MSSPSLSPGMARQLPLAHGALLASLWLGRKGLGKWRSHLLVSDLNGRWQCSGDFLGVRMQPFSSWSFWLAKGAVGCSLEGLFICEAAEEVGNDAANVWEVSVLGVCLSTCLPFLL